MLLTSSIFAQFSLNAPNNRAFKAKYQKNSIYEAKSLTVEVTSLNKYNAGTSMDLNFKLTLTTPDYEYGDYFEMTFPEGIIPTDGTNPFSTPTEGQSTENLNGIDGQKISWGDDDNSYGGIEPGDHYFTVSVTIDASVTGDKTIDFYMSGDQYGAAPNEFSGTITIGELPNVPDLAVSVSGFLNEYYTVPFDQVKEFSQVTSTVQAIVVNQGAELTEATNITAQSNHGYNDALTLNVPMASENIQYFSFESFVATQLGVETFTFTANASNDFNTDNGTAVANIEVHETDLIRDNGEIVNYFGVGSGGGDYLGNVFTINNTDTLNAVTLFLGGATLNDVLKVDVFNFDENGVGDMVASSNDLVITGQNQEFIAYFSGEGVVLEPGQYLFAVKEDVNNMTLAYTSTPYVDGSAWVYYQGQWQDLGAMGYPHTYYIRPGFGTELPEFDIELKSLDMYQYVAQGTDLKIVGTLVNHGTDPLTSIDYSYTVNGGDAVVESITGTNISGVYQFELTTPVNIDTVGDYNIVVTISNMNGGEDANMDNNTASVTVSALEFAPTKRVFGEEATGTWCGWCPRGAVMMDYMASTYPDTWIGVAVHNNDPMTVTEYDDGIGNFIGGYPSGLVDRTGDFDPLNFESVYLERINKIAPIDIRIENVIFNEETMELSFDVAADFLTTVEGARFNAIITENGVTGSSSGYDQANYYSGGANGEMGGYENLPDTVPAADMVYNHVGRAILGGWDGVDGSIASTIGAGESASYTFTTTLNDSWNVDELEFVGLVIANNGEILNAAKGDIHTSIFSDKALAKDFSLYPNPFNESITLSNLQSVNKVIISNIVGQIINMYDVSTESKVIPMNDIESGIYMITIVDKNNNSRTKRIIKQ